MRFVEGIPVRARLNPNWPSSKERRLQGLLTIAQVELHNLFRRLLLLADFQLYNLPVGDGAARRFKCLKFPSNDLAFTFLYALTWNSSRTGMSSYISPRC